MKKLLSIILAATMAISCLGRAAYAANETSASTEFTFDIESHYIVFIPYTFDLNQESTLPLYAQGVDLPEGKELVVSIDPTQSAMQNDMLLLTSGERTMAVEIRVGGIEDSDDVDVTDTLSITDYVVAVFESENDTPVQYGALKFTPLDETALRGHYSCTLYYTLELRDSV